MTIDRPVIKRLGCLARYNTMKQNGYCPSCVTETGAYVMNTDRWSTHINFT